MALSLAVSQDLLATCAELEAEITRIITTKFRANELAAHRVMQKSLARAHRVELSGTVKVCRDPDDDMILECALRSNSDFIVTGDKYLLILREFEGIRIVTAAEYVRGAEG